MKITEIKVRVGRTLNFGHYEGARVDLELAAKLDDGDDPDVCFEQLYQDARRKLNRKAAQLVETQHES